MPDVPTNGQITNRTGPDPNSIIALKLASLSHSAATFNVMSFSQNKLLQKLSSASKQYIYIYSNRQHLISTTFLIFYHCPANNKSANRAALSGVYPPQ